MSEPIKASDTPAAASTPKDADAKSRRKRITLFALLAVTWLTVTPDFLAGED